MTSREVMMRSVEALSNGGLREASRLIRDAKTLHDAIMECDDGEAEAPKRGRPRADAA